MKSIERKNNRESGRTRPSHASVISLGLCLLLANVQAFQPSGMLKSAQRQQQTSLQAMMDPSDIPSMLNGLSHHVQAAAPMMDHAQPASADSTLSQSDMMTAWLSTLYSTVPQMQAKLRPLLDAEGHWKAGVSEQQQRQILDMLPQKTWNEIFVQAGIQEKPHFPRDLGSIDIHHSIKPNMEELAYHKQIEKIDVGTAKDLFPQLSQSVQVEAQSTMDKGKMVLDAAKIRGGSTATHDAFAGGRPTATLLPTREHSDWNGQSVPAYVGKLKWTEQYLRVFDKLPFLAFAYTFVEFFVLRNGFFRGGLFDIYKEEVEDDPEGVAAETASDFVVRAGIFFVLAMLTLTFTS